MTSGCHLCQWIVSVKLANLRVRRSPHETCSLGATAWQAGVCRREGTQASRRAARGIVTVTAGCRDLWARLAFSARTRAPAAVSLPDPARLPGPLPMSDLQTALDQIAFARRYTLGLLESIDPADWFRMPPGGVTHVAWQVGHLAFAQYRLALERVVGLRPGDAELVTPGFLALF